MSDDQLTLFGRPIDRRTLLTLTGKVLAGSAVAGMWLSPELAHYAEAAARNFDAEPYKLLNTASGGATPVRPLAKPGGEPLNGALVYRGDGFDNLCSARDYANFELLVDWRMEPKAGILSLF